MVGVHADPPDDFAVVLLATLAAGDTLLVTDRGVMGDGALGSSAEGVRAHTAAADEVPGTVLRLSNFSSSLRIGRAHV